MTDDLQDRIGHAVRTVLARACETFLDGIDNDEFTALAFVITDSVMKEAAPVPRHDPGESHDHTYLSTSCLHFQHSYCRSTAGRGAVNAETWAKRPASCKFCHAPCVCICHVDREDPAALRTWLAARRDPDRAYPRDTTEFSRLQRERLIASLQENDSPAPSPTEDTHR